jgi:hypothetical protein
MLKVGDKIIIKDINAVLKANFSFSKIHYERSSNHFEKKIINSLKILMKHGGHIDTIDDYTGKYFIIVCEYIDRYGNHARWFINKELLYLYDDMSLEDDLFKI